MNRKSPWLHKLFASLVICACILPAAAASRMLPENAFNTIKRGFLYRSELLESFEGCVGKITFADVGSDTQRARANKFVQEATATYLAYKTLGEQASWLQECARVDVADGSLSVPYVDAFHQGIWARRIAGARQWHGVSVPSKTTPLEREFGAALLLRTLPDEVINKYFDKLAVVQQEVGGSPQYRCRIEGHPTPDSSCIYYMWVDPRLGWAYRQRMSIAAAPGHQKQLTLRYGEDLKEYAPGLWLPTRSHLLVAHSGDSNRIWQLTTQVTYLLIGGQVNKALSSRAIDFFDHFAFSDQLVSIDYHPKLVLSPKDADTRKDETANEVSSEMQEGCVVRLINDIKIACERGPMDEEAVTEIVTKLPELEGHSVTW